MQFHIEQLQNKTHVNVNENILTYSCQFQLIFDINPKTITDWNSLVAATSNTMKPRLCIWLAVIKKTFSLLTKSTRWRCKFWREPGKIVKGERRNECFYITYKMFLLNECNIGELHLLNTYTFMA